MMMSLLENGLMILIMFEKAAQEIELDLSSGHLAAADVLICFYVCTSFYCKNSTRLLSYHTPFVVEPESYIVL